LVASPTGEIDQKRSTNKRMAKKSRRARKRTTKAAQPARISRPTRSQADTADVELAAEYRYVVEDLRRIGITALALLVLLIVLAIIIA
jgi:hypothetical protein